MEIRQNWMKHMFRCVWNLFLRKHMEHESVVADMNGIALEGAQDCRLSYISYI